MRAFTIIMAWFIIEIICNPALALPLLGSRPQLDCESFIGSSDSFYKKIGGYSGVTRSLYFSTCYKKSDEELNRFYKQIKKNIKEPDENISARVKKWLKTLVDTQKAWIKFKETDCQYLWIFEIRPSPNA